MPMLTLEDIQGAVSGFPAPPSLAELFRGARPMEMTLADVRDAVRGSGGAPAPATMPSAPAPRVPPAAIPGLSPETATLSRLLDRGFPTVASTGGESPVFRPPSISLGDVRDAVRGTLNAPPPGSVPQMGLGEAPALAPSAPPALAPVVAASAPGPSGPMAAAPMPFDGGFHLTPAGMLNGGTLPPPMAAGAQPRPQADARPIDEIMLPSNPQADLPPNARPAEGTIPSGVPTPGAGAGSTVPDSSLLGRLQSAGSGISNWIDNHRLTLMALGSGMMGAQSIGQGLSRGGQMALPAMQADIQRTNQNATANWIAQKMPGVSPELALAMATNPAVMQQILPRLVGAKQWQMGERTDVLGQKKPFLYDPVSGETKDLDFSGAGGAGGGAASPGGGGTPGQMTLSNLDLSRIDPNIKGWDYLKQYPQEVQDAAKAYMSGGVMPSGNPRMNGVASIAKMAAQKVAIDIGQPTLADDINYAERRKMRTDLASSGANTTGGILSNGKSAFEHLATLSDNLAKLGNYSGPNVPGGAHVGAVGNFVGNVVAPTPDTAAKIAAVNDNALKYGQEATKFYAGSGGGEGERMAAIKAMDPKKTSGAEQAAFLATEKELMLGRLKQKEAQVRDVMGEQYLAEHPVMTKDLQETLAKIDANIARLRGEAPAGHAAPAGGAPAAPAAVPEPGHYNYDPATGRMVKQ